MQRIRERITYANVMSSLAVFLILGGGAALAAKTVLPKKSVGTKQLKGNSVTAAKLKKNAVTTAKIKNNAVTGAKVNEGTLGQVPSSATTAVIKTSKGTLPVGQQATVLEHGPLKLIVKCRTYEATQITAHFFIESSTDGSVFTSWEDGLKNLGPGTPEDEREVTDEDWSPSAGKFAYEGAAPVSATAATGEAFTAFLAFASEKDTNTCWYWVNGTVL